ncbi:MAG: histidine phosphatase family protein, partial [Candidatus Nanoarchaeia archaeon]|nr:histidine phosphatase family protein [Candidatus Nanoarchaeia archaeon]
KRLLQGFLDIELNDEGKKQAKKLAERLKNHNIEIMFVSPLKRSMQTAEQIKKFHPKAKVIIDEDLKEINFGIFEGLSKEEIKKKYAEMYEEREKDKFNYRSPEGESLADVEKRAIKMLDKVLKTKKDSIIVAHGTLNILFFKNLMKKSYDEIKKHKYNNTSVSIFNIEENDVFVDEFNCDKHLKNSL